MGITDINFRKTQNVATTEIYDPVILTSKTPLIKEATTTTTSDKPVFKGEVKRDLIKFPVALGEAHPFDFAITEGLYKSFGFATGVIDKYVDFIVGPGFFVESEDERAVEIIEQWMQDVNFDTVLRQWVKEALVKNGFLELGGKPEESIKGVKVLDSKWMYVKRDNKGTVEKYNQYRGAIDSFSKDKVNDFSPHQIAHLAFNKIGDMAYGLGIIWPGVNTVNNLLQNEKDLHMLMHRKANSPYHIKMGGVVGGKYFKPNPTTVAQFGKDLQWLNNKHEWVTDGLTEIKTVDFGNIGEKFNEVLRYDTDMLLYTFQVPSVLMGTGNINEGIAKVQMDGFERKVTSFQAEIEKVIEQKIFKRILNANGIDVHVEFQWGRPSNTERYARLDKLSMLMGGMSSSESLRRMLEREAIKILELNEEEYEEMAEIEDVQKEEDRKREEERPQPLVPGQNAKKPQKVVKQSYAEEPCPHCVDIEESGSKYNDIEEWLRFNYKDYVKSIEKFIKADAYKQIAASTALEEAAGMLSQSQVKVFKRVLSKGFKNGSSIDEMVSAVNKNVGLKDLLKMENGVIVQKNGIDVVVKGKDMRGVVLVRTEVTRAANEGAMKHFKEGGINKIRWVSSFGARTCPDCEALNGNIYEIGKQPSIPLHPMCRCTVAPVTELS